MINSTSVIEDSPRYHFSLSSYRDFCKSCFCYALQIRTFENGCEKLADMCDNILLFVKEICSGDLKLMHEVNIDEKQLGDSTILSPVHTCEPNGSRTANE